MLNIVIYILRIPLFRQIISIVTGLRICEDSFQYRTLTPGIKVVSIFILEWNHLGEYCNISFIIRRGTVLWNLRWTRLGTKRLAVTAKRNRLNVPSVTRDFQGHPILKSTWGSIQEKNRLSAQYVRRNLHSRRSLIYIKWPILMRSHLDVQCVRQDLHNRFN